MSLMSRRWIRWALLMVILVQIKVTLLTNDS
jgi:hypothetical protein